MNHFIKRALVFACAGLAAVSVFVFFLMKTESRQFKKFAREERAAALSKAARVCASALASDKTLAPRGFLAAAPARATAMSLLDPKGIMLMHADLMEGGVTQPHQPAQFPELQKAALSPTTIWESFEKDGKKLELGAAPLYSDSGERVATLTVLFDAGQTAEIVSKLKRKTLKRMAPVAVLLFLLGAGLAKCMSCCRRPCGAPETGDERKDPEGLLQRVIHDLRNPLGAMINQTETVASGLRGPVNEAQEKSLRTVIKNGNYLMSLVNGVLDADKLEAGKMDFTKAEVGLKALAEDVMELAKPTASEVKVELGSPDVAAEARVWGDEQALRRVLTNLVFNSLKFTPEGGSVRILHSKTAEGHDRVGVQDTGIGIPEDKIKTLFQKFSQIEETKDKVRKSKGTGLGLVICKEIVEAHGGRIWAESVYRKGTTFFFTLPPKA